MTLAVVALAVSAGCVGSSGPSQEELSRDADYDWTTDANVTVTVNGSEYQAVADVSGRDSVTLSSTSALGGRHPVRLSAVEFRYPNGTVVGADAISVSTSNTQTTVEFPASNGTFAFTASAGSRSVTVPTAFDGSYEVVLPEGMRTAFPVFGAVSPGGYEKRVAADRVHLRWGSVSADAVNAEFYLQRDLYIFGGIVGVLVVLALLGVVYFRLQIRQLERNREQAGLDLERE
ncbi:DUF5803 family protein [Halobacterium zhouii]|uniref:DUF5803 family protein n=1 Tax=Halobacterium zhouii TaxID=2902624 RepID=UPI001E37AD3F|nr:DUF5803 family protein [Halobacterium zhouii]